MNTAEQLTHMSDLANEIGETVEVWDSHEEGLGLCIFHAPGFTPIATMLPFDYLTSRCEQCGIYEQEYGLTTIDGLEMCAHCYDAYTSRC